MWVHELAVAVWAERAGGTPWHAHHVAERYGGPTLVVVPGAIDAVAGLLQAQRWSFDLVLDMPANAVDVKKPLQIIDLQGLLVLVALQGLEPRTCGL